MARQNGILCALSHFANSRYHSSTARGGHQVDRDISLDLQVPGKSSLNRRKSQNKSIALYCRLSVSLLHLRRWIDRNTLKKLEAALTLEKSAHPCFKTCGEHGCKCRPDCTRVRLSSIQN
ncbi:hypothetical protein TNCV_825411 [Trichonephila clavipes]|nr:hypothetical protein TNCV_825411 [Trichonephila clavipes]